MTVTKTAAVLTALLLTVSVTRAADEALPQIGMWRAWLDSPGGELPFDLQMVGKGGQFKARIGNGPEKIPFSSLTRDGKSLTFSIDYYDARITATTSDGGKRLDGEWIKTGRAGELSRLPFHAIAGKAPRFPVDTPASAKVAGRWSVKFSQSDDQAVGQFDQKEDGTVTGTFLTVGGDYRFLAGSVSGNELRLSSFDGAHAFLFKARLGEDGSLKGDFWSRDTWHETWSAERDDNAKLEGGFVTFEPDKAKRISNAAFRDLDGKRRTLGEPALGGRVTIIEVFGSWCPNCHDATAYLVDVNKRYRRFGVKIIGMAFELTGDFERDAKVVRAFADRHKVNFPILIAGLADKDQVKAALPALDKLRAYPTTLFIDHEARVRAVHTGFSGPATGEAYEHLRAEFERQIQLLLAEAPPLPKGEIRIGNAPASPNPN